MEPTATVTITAKSGNIGEAKIYITPDTGRASAAIGWKTEPSEEDTKDATEQVAAYLHESHGFSEGTKTKVLGRGKTEDISRLTGEMEKFLKSGFPSPLIPDASVAMRTREEINHAIGVLKFAAETALVHGDKELAMELSGTIGVLRWTLGADDTGFARFLEIVSGAKRLKEQTTTATATAHLN